MARLHLFEFNDQKWLPQTIRITMMELLTSTYSFLQMFRPFYPKIKIAIDQAKSDQLQFLCAGGGGPIIEIAKYLSDSQKNIVLTDKFPDINKYRQLQQQYSNISYEEKSIDVFDVPSELKGTRIIINAVHHFKPEQVTQILQDTVSKKSSIVFAEPVQREFRCFFNILLALPIFMLLGIFGMRSFSFRRFFWATLFPVAAILALFDGLVSTLRAYKTKEWQQMVAKVDKEQHYQWELGQVATLLTKVTYLIGHPKGCGRK